MRSEEKNHLFPLLGKVIRSEEKNILFQFYYEVIKSYMGFTK